MIDLDAFLDGIRKNAQRIKHYQTGASGENGNCDCVGLIIGALQLCGQKYTGIHGSNYFARYCTDNLRTTEGDTLTVGDLVYKALEPGQEHYNLPDRYSKSPDQRDYYHIGVVMSVQPLCVWHCSTGGMNYDKKLGRWAYHGWCKTIVSGAAKEAKMKEMIVTAQAGTTVKMRGKPSLKCNVYWNVPVGSTVEVTGQDGTWSAINWAGHSGYMMTQYLAEVAASDTGIKLTVPLDSAKLLYSQLKAQLEGAG